MVTLAEVESAAVSLPVAERQQLIESLTRSLQVDQGQSPEQATEEQFTFTNEDEVAIRRSAEQIKNGQFLTADALFRDLRAELLAMKEAKPQGMAE